MKIKHMLLTAFPAIAFLFVWGVLVVTVTWTGERYIGYTWTGEWTTLEEHIEQEDRIKREEIFGDPDITIGGERNEK